jgi:hypothetical protein
MVRLVDWIRRTRVQVRYVYLHAGALSGLDGLGQAVADRWQPVPHVGVIGLAFVCRHTRQGDQLVEAGEQSRRVRQSGGEAPRTLLQPIAQQSAHPIELRRSRRYVRTTYDEASQRVVAHQGRDIGSWPETLDCFSIAGDRAPGPLDIRKGEDRLVINDGFQAEV